MDGHVRWWTPTRVVPELTSVLRSYMGPGRLRSGAVRGRRCMCGGSCVCALDGRISIHANATFGADRC